MKLFLTAIAVLPLFCACNTTPEDITDLPSQHVTYNDSIQIHYKSWGKGPETMVFVHGFGCDMNAWEAQYDAFKQEKTLRMVFVDLPGFGQSDKPHVEYTLDFLGGGVFAVLDELHIDFASLVGHSLGTPVCRQMLIKNPSRIAGICDVDGVYCLYPKLSENPTPEELEAAAQYEQAVQGFASSFDGEACKSNIEGFVQSLAGPNTPAAIVDYAMQTMPNTPEYVASSVMHNLIDRQWWTGAPLAYPVEVICTQNSGLEPDNREQMLALYPDAEYTELETCGHFIQMEQPELVNSRLNALRAKIKKDNLEDYDFCIREIEQNYAGFPFKVTDANRTEYEQLKQEYRDSIATGAMYGAYGASEICCYIHDYHMGCPFKLWSNRFPMDWPNYGEQMQVYAPEPMAQKLNDQTFLLRFPSCNGDDEYVKWVYEAVEQYRLSGCPQLIVDIRGNGGGADYQYKPILDLLYLQPGLTDGTMMRNSKDNRDRIRESVNGNEFWMGLMDKCEAQKDSAFVELFATEQLTQEKGVDAHRPQKTAVIIDRMVGSSGEQFVLDIRSVAPDIKLYGKENTLGCIDISNVCTTLLPHTPANICIPVTVSQRAVRNRNTVDGIGIEPDVRIDLALPDSLTNNVDSWVLWVEEQMTK